MSFLNHIIQESKMKHININDYKKVYRQYMLNDPTLIQFIDKRNNYGKNDKIYFSQSGGAKVKKLKYKHDSYTYILYEIKNVDGYDISIRRKNDIDNPQSCLHILINTELRLAYIQNISYYKDCVDTGLEHPGGGSKLLKMCIQFLKDTVDRYNVKRIQLKDNSMFTCHKNNKKIKMSLMHTLLYGDTWYGKYGFRPYDPYNDVQDKELSEIYEKNIIIVKTTKTKDTNIYNYLYDLLLDNDQSNKEKIKEKIDNYYKKYANNTINVLFRNFLMNFENACAIFSQFYIGFCIGLHIYDFTGESFYLDIEE